MHAFLSRLNHPIRRGQKVYLVCKYARCQSPPYLCWLKMFASTDLEATDPKFDDIKILTRSQQGNLITIPIKVSIMMNINIFKVISPV